MAANWLRVCPYSLNFVRIWYISIFPVAINLGTSSGKVFLSLETDLSLLFTLATIVFSMPKITGELKIFLKKLSPWFFIPAILEELVADGRLKGSLSGGRQDKAQYVPDIYTSSQNEWVDNFFSQNGYLGLWACGDYL